MRPVVLHRRARRSIARFPAARARHVADAIEEVAAAGDPGRHRSVRRMAGEDGQVYRLRVGSYRVVFSIEEKDGEEILMVSDATTRGDAYR